MPLIKDLAKVCNLVIDAVANQVYDSQLPLFLVTDASQKSIGSMLFLTTDDNKVLPLGFFSKALSQTQCCYAALDMGLLAVEQSILFYHHLLDCNTFTVYTDHKPPLTLFKAKPTLNKIRRRRLQFVSQFEMQVKHIAGVHNEIAEYLSRVLLKYDPEIHQVYEALMSATQVATLLQ